jgi:hypothetical protein
MIYYVATHPHRETVGGFLRTWGRSLAGRMRILSYETVLWQRSLPAGTYIFSDLERLGPAQTRAAARVWEQLRQAGPSWRLLNHPEHSLRRFALQRALVGAGWHTFRLWRAVDLSAPYRLPAFIRYEPDHKGSLTPLLHSRREVERALARLLSRGIPLGELLIAEFCDTADANGLYRKYSAFMVDGQIVPRLMDISRRWMLKVPDLLDPECAREELAYLQRNPH